MDSSVGRQAARAAACGGAAPSRAATLLGRGRRPVQRAALHLERAGQAVEALPDGVLMTPLVAGGNAGGKGR